MRHEIDLSKYEIRTDLVMETLDTREDLTYSKEEKDYGDIHVTDVVLDDDSASLIGKKKGRYITINFFDVTDHKNRENLVKVITEYLCKLLSFLKIKKEDRAFVVGLGNIESTPDALGPKAIEKVFVTKYLFDLETKVEPGIRNVSCFIPGVMGTTGIESSDVILGITSKTKPDFIIAVDALASSSVERVNKTIQMTDTGIHPGSGVGNSRLEISKDTIGIPVIAIGIPTVVDAVTIVSDTIHYLLKQMSYNKENYKKGIHKLTPVTSRNYINHEETLSQTEKEDLLGIIGTLKEEEVKSLIFEVLTPIGYNMMVTPKEVDFVINQLSEVISKSINLSLHEKDLSN